MSFRTSAAVSTLLAVALVSACTGNSTKSSPGSTAPSSSAAGGTAASPTDAASAGVDLGPNGDLPRSLVVGGDGRVTVLLTGGSDDSPGSTGQQMVTVQDMRVVGSVALSSPSEPTDLAATRDQAGNELLAAVAEAPPRNLSGEPTSPDDPLVSLLTVAGDVVAEHPLAPETRAGHLSRTRVVASPDGRTLYVVTGDRGADAPTTARTVDPATGAVTATATIDPQIPGLTSVTRTELAVGDDGSLWVAVSGDTIAVANESAQAAALVHLSADLAPLSVDQLPDATVEALALDQGAPMVVLRKQGAHTSVAVVAPTSERGDNLPISTENLASTGMAVSGGTIAVSHEGVDGRPTVSTGRLGSDPRTVALCTENGDTWDVAAAPDGGFYVIGTCADVPRLWLVH
jgi:hypothetical protein